MIKTLVMQPSEALKKELPVPGAGAIASILAVSAESRGLVAGSAPIAAAGSLTAGMLFLDLSGGTDGERYLVTARVETAAGETREAELEVAIVDGAWAMPDGGAGYVSISDMVRKYGLEELVRMTDADGSGRIDRTLLVTALSDVQAVADAYIAARYQVPLASPPEIVKVAIADMARARLYPRGAPDGVAEAAKAGLRLLEQISKGSLQLPSLSSAPVAETPSTAPIAVSPGRRAYPDGLRDY
jgi:phage gp36-like protein